MGRRSAPGPAAAGPVFAMVDAFATAAFRGNQAGVVILAGPADERWMARLAAELGYSETAFTHRLPDGRWSLRWFTPAVEVLLCGHATLATAHELWYADLAPAGRPVRFTTRSGPLVATMDGDEIALDLPTRAVRPAAEPPGLAGVLGGAAYRFVGQTGEPEPRDRDYLVELADEPAVRDLRPDLARLAGLPTGGLVVTAHAGRPGADIVSRYFAPRQGIDEDPVTGAAHCVLGAYWHGRLGRADLRAEQVSQRGGRLRVSYRGERTTVRGGAVTVLRGQVLAGPPGTAPPATASAGAAPPAGAPADAGPGSRTLARAAGDGS